ncbi:hypothetical protein CL652_00385 [bacterium]|nr:hypothetical protein [bacterium]|tara:strand:- start:133 stop:675 length:543 start_codon:yes stop_codon:yes gene_type:complete
MKNTLFIVLVTVGVVSMVISTMAYTWVFAKVRNTIAQVSLTAEETQLLATKNAQTQTLRRIVRDTQQEREELDTYFVTGNGIVRFLEDIEALAKNSGAKVSVETVGEGSAIDKDGLVRPLMVDLKLDGTLQEIFYALSLIETFPKAIVVRTVRITQHPTERAWQGVVSINVTKVETFDGT